MASRSRVYHYVFIVLIIINDYESSSMSNERVVKSKINYRSLQSPSTTFTRSVPRDYDYYLP